MKHWPAAIFSRPRARQLPFTRIVTVRSLSQKEISVYPICSLHIHRRNDELNQSHGTEFTYKLGLTVPPSSDLRPSRHLGPVDCPPIFFFWIGGGGEEFKPNKRRIFLLNFKKN